MQILRFYSHLSLALAFAFVFTPDTATAQGGEINVRGYFGTSIPSGQINATGSNGSFVGTVDSIDSAPITRTFTIENTASQFDILTLTGTPKVSVSGPHADDFTVTQPSAIAILGGGSTTFEVTFTPEGGGIRDATITIPNNDPDGGEAPYTFAITPSPMYDASPRFPRPFRQKQIPAMRLVKSKCNFFVRSRCWFWFG